MLRTSFAIAVTAATLAPVNTAAKPVTQPVTFTVERKGSEIGTYTARFSRTSSGLKVTSRMNLKMRLLGLPVYSYRYTAEEVWKNNQLQALDVSVNDNGKRSSVKGARTGGAFAWNNGQRNYSVNGNIFPSNHWNANVLNQRRVLNTLTGKVNTVSIRRAGSERLNCSFGTVTATRYVYSGQLKTEAWYTSSGRWVGLRFDAQDGSTIMFKC